ncbi:MAG TPA: maleylpyruvate isomerase N-terminal domain-containing protein [Acidimicrobiia bacterium]
MSEAREVFLEAVDAAVPLLEAPEMTARWEEESALARFRVRGLAGHLLRATTSVEAYLDGPEPGRDEEVLSAAAYYAAAVYSDIGDARYAGPDLESDLHRAVRARGEEAAAGGPEILAREWSQAAGRLRARLAAEAPDRRVRVFNNLVIRLDDYLATRLVELCIHTDDLAVSLGVDPPPLPAAATGLAVATLVDLARLRHGDTAVLRALARRERDVVAALRVL